MLNLMIFFNGILIIIKIRTGMNDNKKNNWKRLSSHQAVLNIYEGEKCVVKVWVVKSSDGIIIEEVRSFPFRKQDKEKAPLVNFRWTNSL